MNVTDRTQIGQSGVVRVRMCSISLRFLSSNSPARTSAWIVSRNFQAINLECNCFGLTGIWELTFCLRTGIWWQRVVASEILGNCRNQAWMTLGLDDISGQELVIIFNVGSDSSRSLNQVKLSHAIYHDNSQMLFMSTPLFQVFRIAWGRTWKDKYSVLVVSCSHGIPPYFQVV